LHRNDDLRKRNHVCLDRNLSGNSFVHRDDDLPRDQHLRRPIDLSGLPDLHRIRDLPGRHHLSSDSDLRCRRPIMLWCVDLHRIADLQRDSDLPRDFVLQWANVWKSGDLPADHVSWHDHLPVDHLPRIADVQRQPDLSGLRNMHWHTDMPRHVHVPRIRNLPWDTDLRGNDDLQRRWFPDLCCRADVHGIQYLLRHVHLQWLTDLHHHVHLRRDPHMHVGEHMRLVTHLHRHGDL
jgi:hypothetical protein